MKKFWIGLLGIVMAMSMVACSNSPDTSGTMSGEGAASDQGSEMITVEDMKGTVSIPANPQRVVDVSGSADELIILDVPFVGSANTSMFDGVTVPPNLEEYFTENNVEVVGNYSGSVGELNLEKIAELNPDLIIMNIRHEKVYDQLKEIAPTVMLNDDINYVNWKGRFQQLGEWFGKEDIVTQWLEDYDKKSAEFAEKVKAVTGDETFSVIEKNSVRTGSYYVYRTGGPGELVYDAMKLPASAGVPEGVWGEVVDAEYFSKIDADHIFFFSDDGTVGDTADLPTWQNLKAVKNGNVYCGLNEMQYDLAFTPNGKLTYMEQMANAIINHENIDK